MRQLSIVIIALLFVACSMESEGTLVGCRFGNSEADKLTYRIRQAQSELLRARTNGLQFTHHVRLDRPYVIVVLPPDGVTKADISTLELPREAKMWLESAVDNRSLPGAILGLLQPDRAEWHPLPEGVSATEMLHAWKQPGEELVVDLTRTEGETVLVSLR